MKPWEELPRPWIADIGSGGDPWPLANILVDKFPEDGTVHRKTAFRTEGKIFVEADVANLPFEDGELDWVRCSHVLEHTAHPRHALDELQRVSTRGEAWVPSVHAEAFWRWHTQQEGAHCLPSGHEWLCSRLSYETVAFVRFHDVAYERATECLTQLGLLVPSVKYAFGTELRIAWGWGSWPERVEVEMYELTMGEKETKVDE